MQNKDGYSGGDDHYRAHIDNDVTTEVGGPAMNAEAGTLHLPRPTTSTGHTSWRPRAATIRARVVSYLLSLDLLCIIAGFLSAALLRQSLFGETQWALLLTVTVPAYVAIAFNLHAFSTELLQDPFAAIRRGLQSLLFTVTSVIFMAFALKTSDNFPRLVTAIGLMLSAGLMVVARYFFARHINVIVGGDPFSKILICDGQQRIPPGRFSVMMAADAYLDPESHDPAMYDRLAKLLQGADSVVVACDTDRRLAWAHALKGAGIQGEIVVPELVALDPLGIGRHGETLTMVVATGPLGWFDRGLKRAFDVAVAGFAALLLSPLLLLVAIAIKLDSRGPILFKQTRIGRGNEMFQVLKFRSMRAELADGAGNRSAARDDDRVTRVGRVIRSTSVDELPQLLNVLRGDMSIVGPRPHALGSRAADKLFWEVDRRYWHRHTAKPGLTGLAQVRGFRGATLEESDLKNRLQADLEYLENWSIWRDIKIIVLTFRVLLHRNAF
jgi:exopolysaccharide biosynthesis polyprenyl glycosylphosphotransferase